MKRLAGLFAVLSLAMLLASPASAQEKPKQAGAKKAQAGKGAPKKAGKKKADRQGKGASLADSTLKKLAELKLSEDQQAQIKKIAAEFEPKLHAAQQKLSSLTTPEQRKTRRDAIAKAKAEGKKPREVVEAYKPTEAQAAAQKEVREVQMAFNKKVNEVLTKEQRQSRRKSRQTTKKPAGEKKPAAKKPAKKKPA